MEPPVLTPSGDNHDKLWIILCHLSLLLGVGFLLPLVVFLVKKQDSPSVASHAKEALNFHISLFIYSLVGLVLCLICIGIPLLILLGILGVVCSIIAAVKASDGSFYQYPLTMRFI